MKESLSKFISQKDFPCVMAKSLLRKGNLTSFYVKELLSPETEKVILKRMYDFIEKFRDDTKVLSSFIISLGPESKVSFKEFEGMFWRFLSDLYELDKENYGHDPRVSSNPKNGDFSYSIMEEAFFILALHPHSPRLSRRFKSPTIVFNPHQQFENLRKNGIFSRIRSLIRKKDEELQGAANPMLGDFGEKSEVFQYLGITYPDNAQVPLKVRPPCK